MFSTIAGSANADVPISPLQKYKYEELSLIKIKYRKKFSVACFATMSGRTYWVWESFTIGKEMGYIGRIEKNFVTVSEMVSVNGGDWTERNFTWPISDKKSSLSARCGSPPTKKTQMGLL